MFNYDLNDAEEQGYGEFELIPKDTVVPLECKVRPGGSGEGGWYKPTNAGDALMLDMEFTIIEGEYSKRKIWKMCIVKGNGSDGHTKAENITRSFLRAMIESAFSISPTDDSKAAMDKRKIEGPETLDGLRFLALVGIEKDKTGKYDDKNSVARVVTPDHSAYSPIKQDVKLRPNSAASAAATTSSATPAWA